MIPSNREMELVGLIACSVKQLARARARVYCMEQLGVQLEQQSQHKGRQ